MAGKIIESIDSNGLLHLSNCLDRYTGEPVTYTQTTYISTDAQCDGVMFRKYGGKYIMRDIPGGVVNVKWFGAKGDVVYVNQNAGSQDIGKGYKDAALTILATDDSLAFMNAWDFLMKLNASLLDRVGAQNFGYKGGRLRFKIPCGNYYLTQPNIFSLRPNLVTGVQSGVVIEGDGVNNTNLIYRETSEGATNFLFFDDNKYPDMLIKDLHIYCGSGKEQLFLHKSIGHTQNWSLRNISASNSKKFFKIDGIANADKIVFDKIKYYSLVPGNVFFDIQNNTQSIGHIFSGCNVFVGGLGSIGFNIQSGGLLTMISGSIIAGAKATLYKVPVGATVNPTNVTFSCYSTKIEIHEDAVWIDIATGVVSINNEKTRFPENLNNNKIIIRGLGKVKLNGVTFPDFPKIAFQVSNATYVSDMKPTVEFNGCMLSPDYLSTCYANYSDVDNLTPFAATNDAGLGRVIAKDCITSSNAITNNFNDGAPGANSGYLSMTYARRTAISKASPVSSFGLPNLTETAIVIIPKGCIICRVGIIKNGNGSGGSQAIQNWKIKDGDGVDLVTLTTASANEKKTVFSTELWKDVSTEALRTLTLYSDPTNSNTRAQGYMVVEYI